MENLPASSASSLPNNLAVLLRFPVISQHIYAKFIFFNPKLLPIDSEPFITAAIEYQQFVETSFDKLLDNFPDVVAFEVRTVSILPTSIASDGPEHSYR